MAVGLWEISLVGQGPQGEAIVNTFHYVAGADEDEADDIAEQLCSSFQTVVLPSFLGAVTDDWDGYVIRCQALSGPNQGQNAELDITGEEGELAGPSAPLQTTAIIRRRAAGGNRKTRGRIFVSPIPKTWVDVNGRLDDGGISLPPLAAAIKEPLTTLENTYGACLHELGGAPGANARLIISTSVSPLAGVMKSRRVRFPN